MFETAEVDPGLDGTLEAYVRGAALAAVAVELPSERVLAASPAAQRLFGPARQLVGRTVETFLVDSPTGGLQLLADGRLTAYETTRRMRHEDGTAQPFRLWVRSWEHQAPVSRALILLQDFGGESDPSAGPVSESGVVIGSAGPELLVDRVSREVERLLGRRTAAVLGTPLLGLVLPEDAARLLVALAQVTTTAHGVSVVVRLAAASGRATHGELVLVPLEPAPSVAFAVTATLPDELHPGSAPQAVVERFRAAVTGARASRNVNRSCGGAELSELSAREQTIVSRLVEGDRVPAIAASMYLSQSTVRSHLSAVFRKVGVRSQQELIEHVRDKRRSV